MTEEQFEEAIGRVANGDRMALHDIYKEYMSYIYSVVFTILKNKENAEDVCSDFFIKLMSIAPSYKGGHGHKGYLATIARNMSIDYLRKYGKEEMVADFEYHGDEDADKGIGMETSINESHKSAEEEVIDNMSPMDAINELPPPEPEIVNLKVMGQLTFKEIAEMLKLPMGTVTWHYREAINRLRRYGYA